MSRLRRASTALGIASLIASAGCATSSEKARAFARAEGFEETLVSGTIFRHVVWRKPGLPADRELHVYLDGDGNPHPTRNTVARDPTPRQPLMLHLMALDPRRSVYVGRPCYWGLVGDAGCTPTVWTLGRYSAAVVDSVAAVIRREAEIAAPAHLVLFGHSGGATLALLAVERGLDADGVVTVGGNLDPDAWATLHGYTQLTGSLNPTAVALRRLPLRHYVGGNDTTMPVELVRKAAMQIGGDVVVVPGFDHQCCWERLWPAAAEFP